MMENETEEVERPPSVRRAFTLRHSAARQVAVNFIPSRQLSYNTLRLRRNNSEHNALLEEMAEAPDAVDADARANMIVREMEQHQRLMEDSPASEELRREALRDLPQGLTMKRHVRAKLSASVSLRSKRRPISCIKSLKYRASFAFKRMRERSRDVIFSLELWYGSIRNIEGHFGSAVGSYFRFLRWLFLLDLLLCALLLSFVVVPWALRRNGDHAAGTPFSFMDLLSGQGSFEDSLLFFGHYRPGDVGGTLPYNMSYAYFFTMLCVYIIFLVLLCYKTAHSYRRNFIETSGGVSHSFASRVFCGWDFGIAVPAAAALHAASLARDCRELLSSQIKKKSTDSFWIRTWKKTTNVAVTALVAAALGAGGYGLWKLLETSLSPLLLSGLLALVLAVCPLLFGLVARMEYYSPRTGLYVTLARAWLLDLAALLLLMVYWARPGPGAQCWETSMGQEVYRLVVLDGLVSLVLLPALEFSTAFVFKLRGAERACEFDIAYNSLTVIYNQAAVWAGALFSPLLVVCVTLKFLLLFFVRREIALRTCQPHTKVWRAEQTQTVFYLLVTMALFGALAALGLLFLGTESLGRCGPFSTFERPRDVVALALALAQRPALAGVLAALGRPAVVAALLLALGVGVYLMRARAAAQRGAAQLLRRLLLLQARDRDFLLAAVDKVALGEWRYSPRSERPADSHTWRYARDVRKPSNVEFHFDASRLSQPQGGPHERRLSALRTRPASWDDAKDKPTDGDTDSSFSWQGSTNCLNQAGDI